MGLYKLVAPSFTDRVNAMNELTLFVEAKYLEVAKDLARQPDLPKNWTLIEQRIADAVERDHISNLRAAAAKLGPEGRMRFETVESKWSDLPRKAARATGMEAPEEFEASILRTMGTRPSSVGMMMFSLIMNWRA